MSVPIDEPGREQNRPNQDSDAEGTQSGNASDAFRAQGEGTGGYNNKECAQEDPQNANCREDRLRSTVTNH